MKPEDRIEQAWDKVHEAEEAFAEACRRFVGADLKGPESDWEYQERDYLLQAASDAGFEYQVALDDACDIEEAVEAEQRAVKQLEVEATKAQSLAPQADLRAPFAEAEMEK
jgi:hypothetical protein